MFIKNDIKIACFFNSCVYVIYLILVVFHYFTFREVEGESLLIITKIVDVEDKFIRQVFLVPPNHPPYPGIHKTILVTTNVYTLNQWQSEVPFQFRV